jgi:hypothetical protein
MRDDALNRLKVKRGSQLPWAKLDEAKVREILAVVRWRKALQARLKECTNQALADRYGMHRRSIDRITAGEAWIHVLDVEDEQEYRALIRRIGTADD